MPTETLSHARRRRVLDATGVLRGALALSAFVAALVLRPTRAEAFWVVNFGPAGTLHPGRLGFAAGLGGQMVFVREPVQSNAFFFIPHAGLRVGAVERLDFGLRLAPVPLPYSTVGPSFGANIDAKVRLTNADAPVGVALIAGIGAAHVLLLDQNRFAWSPNGAALLSVRVHEAVTLTTMARYVYLAIPTAMGGSDGNFLHIAGGSFGAKIDIRPNISVLPEVGAYWYEGAIGGVRTAGPGFQYGIMLSTSFDLSPQNNAVGRAAGAPATPPSPEVPRAAGT